MPFRTDEFRTKVQFITFANMPNLIFRAAQKTGKVSNTVYIQHALCEALARDLDMPLQDLLDALPPPRGPAKALLYARSHPVRTGPGNTVEEVR